MNSTELCRAVSVLALVPLALNAQTIRQRDRVPLKPWTAPLYWQASQPEAETIALRPEAATAQLPTTPLVFVGITPCRVVDTRAGQGFSGAFGPPSLNANASRTFPLQSSTACSIPSTAFAYSMNISVVPPGLLGFITVYPTGQSLPLAATLTDVVTGQILSNSAIVPAGSSGSIDVYALNATDLVIDINGYYVSPGYAISSANTALGVSALSANTTGSNNTAIGNQTLYSNTTGTDNTATGNGALMSNASGYSNTATGSGGLSLNTAGYDNTALGSLALHANTTGFDNTAVGDRALALNTTGSANTAIGEQALGGATGSYNTAVGHFAMASGANGGFGNTAMGENALSNLTGGNHNIAIGYLAAFTLTTGNDNIIIGSPGPGSCGSTLPGCSGNGTIRIGSMTGGACSTCGPQTSFFAAGIRGVTTGNNDAIPVVIDSNGQLGTVSSSRRFKEDIQDMGEASNGLMHLRPVTFRYQKPFADGSKPIQYGLIAEEVEDVYPDLVAHSLDGQIESVKYQVLDSMLLNEVQRQHTKIASQAEQIRVLEHQLKEQQEGIEKLASRLAAMAVQ